MCHPMVCEARRLGSFTRKDFEAFRRRWADLLEDCGLRELAAAAAHFATRTGEGEAAERLLRSAVEEFMLGFALSLLAAIGGDCAPDGRCVGRLSA